jgi:2-C-methyl-D-erythritol 4-phosphate cytidylyltransferase
LRSERAGDVDLLIMAAGRGHRLGIGDKAFVELAGMTLLERALRAASSIEAAVFIAVPAGRIEDARPLCPAHARLIEGGASRSETFERLVAASAAPLLVVHDVVHPFAAPELFPKVIAGARSSGAAIAAGRPTDFVYRSLDVRADGLGGRAERVHDAWLGQSPKAFRRDFVEHGLRLHRARMRGVSPASQPPGWQDPGSIDIAVLGGAFVVAVESDVDNVKITTRADLLRAARLLV